MKFRSATAAAGKARGTQELASLSSQSDDGSISLHTAIRGVIRPVLSPLPKRGGGPALLPTVSHGPDTQIFVEAPLGPARIFLQRR